MWSDWLVFCDCGFSLSALWWPLSAPTNLLGFLLPWTWGISSWLLQQSTAAAPDLGRGVSPQPRSHHFCAGLSLLQGIFPTQGLNTGLQHCRQILYQLSHKGSPRILEWVAYPFSRGFSWPQNWTRVSCIRGGFFTIWAIREALIYETETEGCTSMILKVYTTQVYMDKGSSGSWVTITHY